MKPTLFLLAAGMGSRYGGLKQLDGLGPNGETILSMMPLTPDLVNLFLLSAKISNRISAIKSFLNTKDTFLAKWSSKLWTHCPKVSLVLPTVPNHGVPTTQS